MCHLRRAGTLVVLAFGIHLVTTPGTLLDPFTFVTDLRSGVPIAQ